MHYFIISYRTLLDGKPIEVGITGASASTMDYNAKLIIAHIKKSLRLEYPDPMSLDVIIDDAKEVTKDQFIEAGYEVWL